MEVTESEVLDFMKRYEVATNTHSFGNVSALIHPDALYRFTDGDFSGVTAIREAFENTWTHIENESYTISDLKIIHRDVSSASVSYKFHWVGDVEGKNLSGSGRGTNVMVRHDNELVCIYEHLSK